VRAPHRHGLALGIGDDCAIYRPRGAAEDLLFTTDMTIEGVHFRRETHPPDAVGWRTLARGLSDIAAMGGEPRFCLLSLALAPWADGRWVDRFYDGLLRLARRYGVALAGGDLAHAERVTCDIVVCGSVPRGRALRRDGARAGDHVYVSGRLGGSALGLETNAGPAWRKHLRPEPRIALGRFVREKLGATACMDLSDGFSLDLHRLCLASGVAAELTSPIPAFRGATLDQTLDGGEDYELLFTVRPRTGVPRSFQGLPLARIGAIRRGRAGRVTLDGRPLPARGYDHFRSAPSAL
jgi:thiamine-monophosphate kinase